MTTAEKIRAKIRKRLDARAQAEAERRSNLGIAKRDYEFEVERFCFAKYLRGATYGNWDNADLEKREFVRLNKVTLEGVVGASGGFLIPEETTAEVLEKLKAQAIVRALGATVYPMKSDTLRIRRQRGVVTGNWVGSGEGAGESSTVNMFARDTLVLNKYIGLVPVDNDLLADASPAVDVIIKQDLVSELGLAEDLAFFQGNGNKQPMGMYNDPDITKTVLNAAPTYDDLIDMQDRIEADNGRYSAWAMNPALKNYMRKIKNGVGDYVWSDGDVTKKEPPTLLGLPVALTTQMSKAVTAAGVLSGGAYTYIVLGYWPDFAIGQKAGQHIEMAVSDVAEDAFTQDETWFRAKLRVDCLAKYPECFEILTAVHLS